MTHGHAAANASTDDQPRGFDTVFAEELQALGPEPAPGQPREPADATKLVGLAFSGGGIRSATFGLGVLEALRHHDLLHKIDYLSTVSGGGYIGAWFTANCHRAARRANEPDWRSKDADWSESVRHLRRYSNYLSPEVGFFSADTWSMFTVWSRNALLIQLTVAFCFACVLLLPRLAAWVFSYWPHTVDERWATVVLFILSVVGIAGNLQAVSRAKRVWFLQVAHWWVGAVLAIVLGAAAWRYGDAVGFSPFRGTGVAPGHAFVIAVMLVFGGYCLLPAGVGAYGRVFRPKNRPTQVNYSQGHVQVLIVFPLLVSAFFVAAILWDLRTGPLEEMKTYGRLLSEAWRFWPFPLSIVFAAMLGLSFFSIPRAKWKYLAAALLAAAVSVGVLHLLLCAIVLLLQAFSVEHIHHAFVITPTLVLYALSLVIATLIGMVGRQSTEGVREWWSRLGAWLIIYGAAWVIVSVAAVYGPTLVYIALREHLWMSFSSAAGWVGTVIVGLAAGHSDKTGQEDPGKRGNPLVRLAAQVAPFLFIAGLLIGVATILDLVVLANTGGMSWANLYAAPTRDSVTGASVIVLLVCLVVAGLLGWRIDVNEFSLNAFYRNRLVRCFLGATRVLNAKSAPLESLQREAATAIAEAEEKGEEPDVELPTRAPQNFTNFDDADDLPLSRLATGTRAGPLHLVNCALNLGGSGDLSLHTRHSASFTLSPLHVGSHYCHRDDTDGPAAVMYVKTDRYSGHKHATTLGKAISVSGAAASPNMGYHTSPVVAFLLTVFNLRLGWWFPNPSRAAARSAPRFNLRYMFWELFGGATYQSKFLMVSDGGHFENLAAYELMKRKCAVIVVSDAECDLGLTFEGLGTLIRMCEVDRIAKISIDVGSLKRRDGGQWSDQRCAVGTIDYGGGRTGTLIYLKAALTGLEPTTILQYKASHPTFPHESTGDQFYSEDQFESYRRLGFDITCRALAPAIATKPQDMVTLAARLKDTSSPMLTQVGNFTSHSEALIGLWNKVRSEPKLKALDGGLLGPGVTFAAGTTDAERQEFYTAAEMLQLMENAYLDLRLEETWHHPDNRGWQELFRRWAALQGVTNVWTQAGHLFGVRFSYFCTRELGLPPVPPRPDSSAPTC